MKDSNSFDLSIYDDLDDTAIEALRQILEEEQGSSFTHGEAKEVGVSLLKLFEALADNESSIEVEAEEGAEEAIPAQLSFI